MFLAVFDEVARTMRKNSVIKGIVAFLAITLVTTGAWFGYQSYTKHREQRTYTALAAVMEKVALATAETAVEAVASADAGYAAHAGSHLAPFFLASKADALIVLGNLTEARQALLKAASLFGRTGQVGLMHYLYKTKAALVGIDAQDSAAVTELQDLAGNPSNPLRAMALYYSAEYAIQAGQRAKARAYAEQALSVAGNESPWAQLAQEFLTKYPN